MKILLSAFVSLFCTAFLCAQVALSGNIKDAETGEDLIGATIYIKELKGGTATNVYGFYSISLPEGDYQLVISYIGYKDLEQNISLKADSRQNFSLAPNSQQLEAVEISAVKRDANVKDVQMSTVNLGIEKIKNIPAVFGEVDIIKAIQLLPGVSTAGEGFSGFFVRGGASDQNLILLDEAAVYNSSHLFGFFSVFNPDAVKDVQLYKGGIPARFGGRLASVLDVRMKEGNNKKFTANGGVGLIASRLTLEGPIVKDKGSFLISGRRTYADMFLALSKNPNLKNNKLYFYDFNAKANYTLDDKNRLYASGYFGKDVFSIDNDRAQLSWGNATGTLRWNRIINSKWFSNLTLIKSNYDYSLGGTDGPDIFTWTSHINDLSAKADVSYFQNSESQWKFGAQATHHTFRPADIDIKNDEQFYAFSLPKDKAMEYGIYAERQHDITPRLSATYGLRYSLFQNLGGRDVYEYNDQFEISDTVHVDKGVYKSQGGLEPRLGMRYSLSDETSIKASYNRTYQYIQVASNSTGSSPLDVWFPASGNVKPQIADQIAAGYFRNFKGGDYEASVELYYKWMQNSIDFKNQADLLLNPALEGELRIGTAKAYGAEFLVRKNEGRFNGFISYTLSKVTKTIDVDETLPGKETFAAPYDKRHDLAIVANYTLNKRVSFGANFVYATGAAVTLPNGKFYYKGSLVPTYTARNAGRMESYHRFDLSCTLQSKKNNDRRFKGEWVFSIYNVYSRHNPFSYLFNQDEDTGEPVVEKMYLFPILPSITYNFKF
jgi:hypothetical protein|tara:strand:+ start:19151 stop:21475 length:2325 start_codon:yes stop_codon:yes gene_type:complete